MSYEVNLIYYANLFKKWWKIIAVAMLVSMTLTAIFVLQKPYVYITRVSLFSGSGGPIFTLGSILGLTNPQQARGRADGGAAPIIPLMRSRRMVNDINTRFDLGNRPNFWYSLGVSEERYSMSVVVRGSDPAMIQRIANFAVENLDKINDELDLTAKKPLAKVLDPATLGVPEPRQTGKKVFVAGILAALLTALYGFFSDYIKKLKTQQDTCP